MLAEMRSRKWQILMLITKRNKKLAMLDFFQYPSHVYCSNLHQLVGQVMPRFANNLSMSTNVSKVNLYQIQS